MALKSFMLGKCIFFVYLLRIYEYFLSYIWFISKPIREEMSQKNSFKEKGKILENYKESVLSYANVLTRHIWEAMRHVWPQARWPGGQNIIGIESQL